MFEYIFIQTTMIVNFFYLFCKWFKHKLFKYRNKLSDVTVRFLSQLFHSFSIANHKLQRLYLHLISCTKTPPWLTISDNSRQSVSATSAYANIVKYVHNYIHIYSQMCRYTPCYLNPSNIRRLWCRWYVWELSGDLTTELIFPHLTCTWSANMYVFPLYFIYKYVKSIEI